MIGRRDFVTLLGGAAASRAFSLIKHVLESLVGHEARLVYGA